MFKHSATLIEESLKTFQQTPKMQTEVTQESSLDRSSLPSARTQHFFVGLLN